MTTSLRGTCPVCEQSTAVRQDGNLQAHGNKPPKEDTGRA